VRNKCDGPIIFQCITCWAHESCNILLLLCKYTRESTTRVDLRNQVATDKCAFSLSHIAVNVHTLRSVSYRLDPSNVALNTCIVSPRRWRLWSAMTRTSIRGFRLPTLHETRQPNIYSPLIQRTGASGALIIPLLHYNH